MACRNPPALPWAKNATAWLQKGMGHAKCYNVRVGPGVGVAYIRGVALAGERNFLLAWWLLWSFSNSRYVVPWHP